MKSYQWNITHFVVVFDFFGSISVVKWNHKINIDDRLARISVENLVSNDINDSGIIHAIIYLMWIEKQDKQMTDI